MSFENPLLIAMITPECIANSLAKLFDPSPTFLQKAPRKFSSESLNKPAMPMQPFAAPFVLSLAHLGVGGF